MHKGTHPKLELCPAGTLTSAGTLPRLELYTAWNSAHWNFAHWNFALELFPLELFLGWNSAPRGTLPRLEPCPDLNSSTTQVLS